MILWIFFYLSFAFALPTPSDFPIDNPPPVSTSSAIVSDSRSILGILWSCLSTIFACTWVAVHPNIPGPKEGDWAVFRRRLTIVLYILIAPELVITWAARQHLAAKEIAERYQQLEWTTTHGFFLDMGGFTLHDQRGTALRILTPSDFHKLYTSGEIAPPSTTKKEIQDRSKGDYLSKAFVLIQISWFVTHCIVRQWVYKLAVSELEVATLAFASLTGVIYYLWWHKPLDVRCSVSVKLLQENSEKEIVDGQGVISTSYPLPANPASASRPISCEPTTDPDPTTLEERQITQTHLIISNDPNPARGPDTINSTHSPSHNHSTTPPGAKLTKIQELSAGVQRPQNHGTLLGRIYALLFYPIKPFWDMANCHYPDNSVPLHLPTYYSSFITGNESFLWSVSICSAVVFGAIHCIAWMFYFPSLQEQLAWRISAAVVSGAPILFFLVFLLTKVAPRVPIPNICYMILFVAIGVVFLILRIMLLVLSFITLRALPPMAFVEVHWESFFPHMA